MKKYILWAILLLILPLFAADEDLEGKVVVKFWHAMGGTLGDVLNEMVDDFNETHPEYYIDAINMGKYQALSQKVMASIQAGNQPDLCQLFESWTANILFDGPDEEQFLVPIKELMARDNNFSEKELNDIIPAFRESNSLNGKMWSMPFNKSVRVNYYNKDLFYVNGLDPNKPPLTWEDFKRVAKIIADDEDGDGTPEIYGTTFNIECWQFENLLLQAGGEIMNKDYTKATFNSEEGVRALQYLSDLLNADGTAYLSSGYEGQNDFLASKVGMVEGSSVSMVFMRKTGIDFNLGISAIPVDKTKRSVISGTNVAVFRNKDKQVEDAAWEFVKWFTETAQTARWSYGTYYMPVRLSSFEHPLLKERLQKNPELQTVYDQLLYASFEPPIKEWFPIRKRLNEHVIEKVLRGTIDPKVALDDVAEELDKSIKKNK